MAVCWGFQGLASVPVIARMNEHVLSSREGAVGWGEGDRRVSGAGVDVAVA